MLSRLVRLKRTLVRLYPDATVRLKSDATMRRKPQAAPMLAGAIAAALIIQGALAAQAGRTTPKFYPDDPIAIDDDTAFDASAAKPRELSEAYDFLENTFGSPGDR